MPGAKTFYGKYRGTVVENIDPLKLGRIQVMVPDVSSAALSSWALPCVPLAGKQMGVYVVPQRGAGVWVEFEQGDPDYPIWTGCFWGTAAEVPSLAMAGNPASPSLVLQSGGQHVIVVSDVAGPTGGITLKSTTGASIVVNDTGIYISNGKGASIVLTGKTVSVNDGALTVT
ncbi:MAG: baseplate assembly protein [Candidatus Rokubacteria bacterium]|nr:baseplate assembly protein [Candidatus Rokubacteria bacterium]